MQMEPAAGPLSILGHARRKAVRRRRRADHHRIQLLVLQDSGTAAILSIAGTDAGPAIAESLCRDLPKSLAVHLHQIDLLQARVLLLGLTPEDFARASSSISTSSRQRPGAWFGWEQLEACMAGAPAWPAHFIFHVGHCG